MHWVTRYDIWIVLDNLSALNTVSPAFSCIKMAWVAGVGHSLVRSDEWQSPLPAVQVDAEIIRNSRRQFAKRQSPMEDGACHDTSKYPRYPDFPI